MSEHTAENGLLSAPAEQSDHDWKPTTNTLAVWKCQKCGAVGFDPHPLPRYGCVIPPAETAAAREGEGR